MTYTSTPVDPRGEHAADLLRQARNLRESAFGKKGMEYEDAMDRAETLERHARIMLAHSDDAK